LSSRVKLFILQSSTKSGLGGYFDILEYALSLAPLSDPGESEKRSLKKDPSPFKSIKQLGEANTSYFDFLKHNLKEVRVHTRPHACNIRIVSKFLKQ
jgi:hypothetical protein